MGINVQWYDDAKTILFVQYEAEWTIEDFYDSITRSYDLMETVEHPVDIVQDLTQMQFFPVRLIAMSRFTEAKAHPRKRYMILAGASLFVEKMLDVAKKLAPTVMDDSHFAGSVEAAFRLLDELRAAEDDQPSA